MSSFDGTIRGIILSRTGSHEATDAKTQLENTKGGWEALTDFMNNNDMFALDCVVTIDDMKEEVDNEIDMEKEHKTRWLEQFYENNSVVIFNAGMGHDEFITFGLTDYTTIKHAHDLYQGHAREGLHARAVMEIRALIHNEIASRKASK